ncbi:hypothetical protein KCU78_g4659, partial [Aureobasidium melanogenum]
MQSGNSDFIPAEYLRQLQARNKSFGINIDYSPFWMGPPFRQKNPEVTANMTSSCSSNEGRSLEVQSDDLPIAKSKLSPQDLKYETVFLVYKGYLKLQADAQDDNLENLTRLCLRFNWVPSIDTVNWLIQEANIVNEKHRLNFPIYPFMQEFKFLMCVTMQTNQPRLFVGVLTFHKGSTEVWAGWSETKKDANSTTTVKTELYDSPKAEAGEALELDLKPAWRRHIKWDEPLEQLFQMSEVLENGQNLGKAAQVQDAILLSVAKVVTRFPGLMRVPLDSKVSRGCITRTSGFPERPFDDCEPKSPDSSFLEAHRKLNSGPDATMSAHRCHPPDRDDDKAPDSKASNKSTSQWPLKNSITKKRKKHPVADTNSDSDLSPPSKTKKNTSLGRKRMSIEGIMSTPIN